MPVTASSVPLQKPSVTCRIRYNSRPNTSPNAGSNRHIVRAEDFLVNISHPEGARAIGKMKDIGAEHPTFEAFSRKRRGPGGYLQILLPRPR